MRWTLYDVMAMMNVPRHGLACGIPRESLNKIIVNLWWINMKGNGKFRKQQHKNCSIKLT